MNHFYLLSPLQFFEVIFLLAQILIHATQACYYLQNIEQDNTYRTVVGFGSAILVVWFITSILRLHSNADMRGIHPTKQS